MKYILNIDGTDEVFECKDLEARTFIEEYLDEVVYTKRKDINVIIYKIINDKKEHHETIVRKYHESPEREKIQGRKIWDKDYIPADIFYFINDTEVEKEKVEMKSEIEITEYAELRRQEKKYDSIKIMFLNL